MRLNRITTAAIGLVLAAVIGRGALGDETTLKFADCPESVRKAIELEAKGAKIDTVSKEAGEDGVTVYAANALVAGRHYRIRVDHDGQLVAMDLEVGDDEIKFSACPAAVRETFHREAKDARFDDMTRDIKYGIVIYEAVARLGGKDYSIVVAENGTLVEKMLVVAEDEIELSHCPAAVQAAMKEHARGGHVGAITRSTGIGGHVYEVEIEIEGKKFALEVTEGGALISKAAIEDDE